MAHAIWTRKILAVIYANVCMDSLVNSVNTVNINLWFRNYDFLNLYEANKLVGLHVCDMKNPCTNGGKCMKVYYQNESSLEEIESNEYTCKCATDFTGINCE